MLRVFGFFEEKEFSQAIGCSDASVYEAHLVFEDEVGDDLALGNKVLVPVEKSARWVGDFGYDGLGHDSGRVRPTRGESVTASQMPSPEP